MTDEQESLGHIAEELEGMEGSPEEVAALVREALEVIRGVQSAPRVSEASDLARAVLDFAEWQSEDYIACPDTRQIIGRTLWLEVSDHVRRITHSTPPAFGLG